MMKCDFCGKSQDEVSYIVQGPIEPRACICDECMVYSMNLLIGMLDENYRATAEENRRLRAKMEELGEDW